MNKESEDFLEQGLFENADDFEDGIAIDPSDLEDPVIEDEYDRELILPDEDDEDEPFDMGGMGVAVPA